MSQSNSSIINVISEYTKQFVDKINKLEKENNELKKQLSNYSADLQGEFNRLTERHNELKTSYAEIDRENIQMKQEIEQLHMYQKSIQSDISQYYNKVLTDISNQTPKKSHTLEKQNNAPNQTPIYRKAKSAKLLNTKYNSESDSDSSNSDNLNNDMYNFDGQKRFTPKKLNFNNSKPSFINLSDTRHKNEKSDDENESILKQIITEGLMSGLENLNKSPHNSQFSGFGNPNLNPNPNLKTRNEKKHINTQPNTTKDEKNTDNNHYQEAELVHKIIDCLFTSPHK